MSQENQTASLVDRLNIFMYGRSRGGAWTVSLVLRDASYKCDVLWPQGMDIEAAEKWIVDLIRGSKLDAKIDSRDNSVIMGGTFPSVYQQVSSIFGPVMLSLSNTGTLFDVGG